MMRRETLRFLFDLQGIKHAGAPLQLTVKFMPFSIDYETKSRAELNDVGVFRYAKDPSTDVLCVSVCKDNGPVLVWIPPQYEFRCDVFGDVVSDPGAKELLTEALSSDEPISAFNVLFEISVTENVLCRLYGFPVPARHRWRCTMVLARRANIPASLAKAAECLGLAQQKDSMGGRLIKKFCIPQKETNEFIHPRSDPDAFKMFVEYCRQDTVVERELLGPLKPFELKGWILGIFLESIEINCRGMPLNLDALRKADGMIEAESGPAFAGFRALTDLNPTQNAKVKAWINANGLALDNLQGETLDAIEATPCLPGQERAREAIALMQKIGFASVKKIRTMLDCVGPDDNFIRGSLEFHGASTMRWSGKLHQPQNFKSPEDWAESLTGKMYADLCNGDDKDTLEWWYGKPIFSILANCIRHFIQDKQGPMLSADYTAIEAMILAWLAGEEWRLEVFRTHKKIYEASVSQMFGIPLQEFEDYKAKHGKHHPMRKIGKLAELSMGYQGSEGALVKFGALDLGLKQEELMPIVEKWRAANPKIADFWYACERAAIRAANIPGQKMEVGKLTFFSTRAAGANYLFMKLPSGRNLAYRDPKVTEVQAISKKTGKPYTKSSLSYYGQIPGPSGAKSTKWGHVSLYGGKITENCLAGETQVLTNSGFKRIDCIKASDLLWDGAEFVQHGGLICQGEQPTMDLQGVRCTPDHRFLTAKGFMEARLLCNCSSMVESSSDECNSCKKQKASRFDGQALWPLGGGALARHRRAQGFVDSAVPVRQHHREGGDGDFQEAPSPCGVLQAMPFGASRHIRVEQDTRHVEASGPRSVEFDDTAVHQPEACRLPQLRWARHWGLRRVAGRFLSVLGRHGANLPTGFGHRPEGQQLRVLQGKLPVGNANGQLTEHAAKPDSRGDHRPLPPEWHWHKHTGMAHPQRGEAGSGVREDPRPAQPVYDIRDCGPRRRFAVRGAEGILVIAHNCCQAIAFDIMANGTLKAAAKGYRTYSLIHDEALAALDGPHQNLRDFQDCLEDVPAWCEGLPVSTSGAIVPYYTK
jgi:DNA polymerase